MTQSTNLYAASSCWLYKEEYDGMRIFVKSVTIPSSNIEEWAECTDAEKLAWEALHPSEDINEGEKVQSI